MDPMTGIALFLVVVMLAAAVATLTLRNLVSAVVASSIVSLAVSALFALLRAPDVALTEAAVGAGLGGVVLALGLRRLGLWRIEGDSGRAGAVESTTTEGRRDA